ncbi:MAG: hypothetical protein FWB80_07885 [Defluviitaleaceae bacterium]|nr:hypothetical protein [Defluviitaleaceae bacterium]
MKIKNKNLLIILGVCVVLALGGVFLFIRGGGGRLTEDVTNDPLRPQAVRLRGTYVFYDDAELVREDFTIRKIIGQTAGGYLVVLNERVGGGIIRTRSAQRIVLASECLLYYEDFFAVPPEWEAFIAAAVNDCGRLYVLGVNCPNFIYRYIPPVNVYMYIYNTAGELVERHRWERIPEVILQAINFDTFGVGSTYVYNDILVHVFSNGYVFFTKTGEVLHEFLQDTQQDFPLFTFAGGTVGGGHFYGLYFHGSYMDDSGAFVRYMGRDYNVRKIEIPTGRVVWEKTWDTETGRIENILFCSYREILYLFNFIQMFVYDTNTQEVYFLRDKTNSALSVFRRLNSGWIYSISILGDGRLHFVFTYHDGSRFTHMEWLFTPLYGEAARARTLEIAAGIAETPVIRYFALFPGVHHFGVQHDLGVFADEREALVQIDFATPMACPVAYVEYIETLNAAIFAGTANWDIISTPATASTANFDLASFIERGLLVDLLPFTRRSFIENNERFYTHMYELLLHNGGLYHLPIIVSVPLLLVPNTHPELEYLKERAQSWTWADFLQIVQRMYDETGTSPISCASAAWRYSSDFSPSDPISNVPPFFWFDEDLLFALGRGERHEEFSQTIGLYATLVSPAYNNQSSLSDFTFSNSIRVHNKYFTHAILPLPTMRGEYIFYLGMGYAVLTVGENRELAAEFLIDYHEARPTRFANEWLDLPRRPSESYIRENFPGETFADFEAVIYRVNTFPILPASIRIAIYDVVVQYVHGALTRDVAVGRVADIMWIYVNE